MKGDLAIKGCEYDVGEVNLINWETSLSITKIESTGISMLEVPKFKLLYCNIIAKISTLIFCSTILDIPSLITKLS